MFFYRGTASKISTLIFSFPLLPESIQSSVVPSFIKEFFKKPFENLTKKFDFHISQAPDKIPFVWVDQQNRFEVTEKHFEPFEFQDFSPSKSLADLEKELEKLLTDDVSLAR